MKTRSETAKAPLELMKCGTVKAMVSKRSESFHNDFPFDIEAKRSKLILNCESSEAKRTCSMVKNFISKRSEHVYIKEFNHRSEANTFDCLKSYFKANLNIDNRYITS